MTRIESHHDVMTVINILKQNPELLDLFILITMLGKFLLLSAVFCLFELVSRVNGWTLGCDILRQSALLQETGTTRGWANLVPNWQFDDVSSWNSFEADLVYERWTDERLVRVAQCREQRTTGTSIQSV